MPSIEPDRLDVVGAAPGATAPGKLNSGAPRTDASTMVVCVIPAYRAARTVVDVVRGALTVCDSVIVVDDACPESCGDFAEAAFKHDLRVRVIRHPKNLGVGGAVKSGIRLARELGATYVVKMDADGQMDPRHVPDLVTILEIHQRVALVKGNRFIDGSIARVMPGLRLFGNSALTLLVRMTTGYWSSIDPTNGFLVIRARSLERIDLDSLADRYYFEISLLCAFGMRKVDIAEAEIPAIYGSEPSSLAIGRVIASFPPALAMSFIKRILWQYLIADMNVGSLLLITGFILASFSAIFGTWWWADALRRGVPTTPGTVLLAFAPLMMGFQLLLNALLYDVQFASRVMKVACDDVSLRPVIDRRVASQ